VYVSGLVCCHLEYYAFEKERLEYCLEKEQ
jgi:hypothetical protein